MARETAGPLTSLVKSLDAEIAKNKALKSFLVVLTDDARKTAKTLEAMAADAKIEHVPLTLVAEPGGPPDYEIAKDADVTVMMWTGHKVKVNRAYKKGGLTEAEIPKIIAELPNILGASK
jgi:hypothetical protein